MVKYDFEPCHAKVGLNTDVKADQVGELGMRICQKEKDTPCTFIPQVHGLYKIAASLGPSVLA